MAVDFRVNGKPVSVDAPDGTRLLWVLRERLGFTGTKYGCGVAQCGACMVHVDGAAATGVGQMATPLVAPAVAAAVFAATGAKLTHTPFRPERVLAAMRR